MSITCDLHIKSKTPLASPGDIFKELPLTETASDVVARGRDDVRSILHADGDRRLIVISGPCSVHHPDEALEYAESLKQLQNEVSDRILILMRSYFEKPRTVVGWKGLIYDPDLNGSYNFDKGIRTARKLLLDLAEMGVPTATEILDPIITQYIADAIGWAAIGARTTESQTHRQLVSGLSMPTGFKNATNGDIKVAVEAVQAASHEHSFLGVLEDGRTGIFRTTGNPDCHLVLRGGANGANFGSEWIAYTSEMMKKAGVAENIIVDCSHANSNKQYKKQMDVIEDLSVQIERGNRSIAGVMLESNLAEGNQKVIDPNALKRGVSITDACIGWDDTRSAVERLYKALEGRSL